VEVLHEVSFTLNRVKYTPAGENGAGKSTLVKVITGVHQPDGGQIFLNDQPTHLATRANPARPELQPFTRSSACSQTWM